MICPLKFHIRLTDFEINENTQKDAFGLLRGFFISLRNIETPVIVISDGALMNETCPQELV